MAKIRIKYIRHGLLQHAARGALAGTSAASHRHLLLCLARFGFRFFGAFALALRAMGNVLPARTEDVIVVFFFDFLVVFERNVTVVTKKSGHILFRFIMMGYIDSETKIHHQHDVSKC